MPITYLFSRGLNGRCVPFGEVLVHEMNAANEKADVQIQPGNSRLVPIAGIHIIINYPFVVQAHVSVSRQQKLRIAVLE